MTKTQREIRQRRELRASEYRKQLVLLRSLASDSERREDLDEVRRLKKRIHVIEQQLRYMGVDLLPV